MSNSSVKINVVNTIKKKISNGDIEQCFEEFGKIKLNRELDNSVMKIECRWTMLKKDHLNGTVDYENYKIESNRIISAILELTDEISNKRKTCPYRDLTPTEIHPKPNEIIGFANEISELDALIKKSKEPVLIQGVRGSGKSTLASKFYSNHRNSFEYFGWLKFHSNLERTFVDSSQELIEVLEIDIDNENLKTSDLYRKAMYRTKVQFHNISSKS